MCCDPTRSSVHISGLWDRSTWCAFHAFTTLVTAGHSSKSGKMFSQSSYIDFQLQTAARLAHLMLIVCSTSASIKASSLHPKDFQHNSIVTKTVSSIFIFYMFDPLSFLFAALFRGIVSLHPLSMLLCWISYKHMQKKQFSFPVWIRESASPWVQSAFYIRPDQTHL